MKKILLLIITVIFIAGCSQNVGIRVDPEYNPEVKIISDQNYPEIRSSELFTNLRIEGKGYPILRKDDKETIKLPSKYLKKIKKYNISVKNGDFWDFNFSKDDKILTVTPKTYNLSITLLRQNPKNYNNNRPFLRDDIKNVTVYYKDEVLNSTRYFSKLDRPDKLNLKIPSLQEVKMDDYYIEITIPGYEPFKKSLININDNKIMLKLKSGMMQLNFVNLENSIFVPRYIEMINANNDLEKYTITELMTGISLFDIELPVKLFGINNSFQLFDKNGDILDTLVLTNTGIFDILYKEKIRELPIVFYDISEGLPNIKEFENWLTKAENGSEGVFLYVTNGYEKIYNNNPGELENVKNRIHRINPRTSNVLEALSTFKDKFLSSKFKTQFDNKKVYGNKLNPKYYIFLSDENADRLLYAIDRFVKQFDELEISKEDTVIFTNKKNQDFIKKLEKNNIIVKTL